MKADTQQFPTSEARAEFDIYQQRRRWELWNLLGDLPWDHKPAPPRLVRTEKHDGYTLERLILDLNGIEPVPAVLLIPDRRQKRAPGLLYMHWHAGQYDLGKEQLLRGTGSGNQIATRLRVPHLSLVFCGMWDTTNLNRMLKAVSSPG